MPRVVETVIDMCKECPNYDKEFYTCNFYDPNWKSQPHPGIIPDWCPLPEI